MNNNLNNIDLLDENDLETMNFYETSLYIQVLNEFEKIVNKDGDVNE